MALRTTHILYTSCQNVSKFFRSRNMYEETQVAYTIVQIAKILLAARGHICHAFPKEAVNKTSDEKNSKAEKIGVEPH